MEAYLINVLMSIVPYLVVCIVLTILNALLREKHNLPASWKVFLVSVLISVVLGATMSANTYKNEAHKSPTPTVQKENLEIKRIPPLIEQGKEERQKRFDDLVDWKSRVN